MAELHSALAWAVMVSTGVVGAALTAGYWLAPLRHRAIFAAAYMSFGLVALQATLGALLYSSVDGEVNETHMFYGFLTLAGVGLIIAYRHLAAYRQLLFGLGLLFVMGLAIRSFTLEPVL